MLQEPEWAVARPRSAKLSADLHVLFVVALLATLLLAIFALHRPVTALSGANRYIFNECPTGGRVIVHDWGDNIYNVKELIGGAVYTVGHYPSRKEALAAASRICNNN
jgi:hypothetical protein